MKIGEHAAKLHLEISLMKKSGREICLSEDPPVIWEPTQGWNLFSGRKKKRKKTWKEKAGDLGPRPGRGWDYSKGNNNESNENNNYCLSSVSSAQCLLYINASYPPNNPTKKVVLSFLFRLGAWRWRHLHTGRQRWCRDLHLGASGSKAIAFNH